LCKIWENLGKNTFFWEDLNDILKYWEIKLLKSDKIAITWWASTPYEDIKKVLDWFIEKWYKKEKLLL
jgi:hypothetical protein